MAGYRGYSAYSYPPPYSYPPQQARPQSSSNIIPLIGPQAPIPKSSKTPTTSNPEKPPVTSNSDKTPTPTPTTASTSKDNVVQLIGPLPPVPQHDKMPVSELFELAMRMGLEVKFSESSVTGVSHDREFTMMCTVGSVTAQAKESNKKKAKHSAAAEVLKKLKESDAYKNHLFNRSSKAALASHNNTVGRLQEATVKKGLQSPEYQFDEPSGPPHQRMFCTKVHVGTLVASGQGRSKKEAKRSAAAAMLDNMNCSNLSLHVPAKKIAFKPASSAMDPSPVLFTKGGML